MITDINHSAPRCMKLLLIIYSKPAKVTTKQNPRAILISLFCLIKPFKVVHVVDREMSWHAAYHCSNSRERTLKKKSFTLLKNDRPRKA